MLALLLGALVLRLIFMFDDYFTIRDADFFPAEIHIQGGRLLRGGRLIPMLLSFVWGAVSRGDPFVAKKIAGIAILLFAVPGVALLGIRARLSARAVAFAVALFLASAQVFALYDTMGPYFLLLVLFVWQLIFSLEAREGGRRALFLYSIISLIALLCHRNALMTTGLTLGLIFLGRGGRRIRQAEVAVLFAFFAIGAWKIFHAMRFDALQTARHAAVYENGFFRAVGWEPSLASEGIIEGGLSLLPGWAGVPWSLLLPAAAINLVLLIAVVLGAVRVRRELRWVAALGFCGAVGLAMVTGAVTAGLFFQPNHATYGSVWLPLFVVLLGQFLAERPPRWAGNLLLIGLLAVNIWQGHGFRGEAFDFRGYETFVATELEHGHMHHRRLVPAFLVNEYARRIPAGSQFRPFIPNETLHNDFTTIRSSEFDLDFITYDELGIPLFRYKKYRRYFEAWAARHGLEVNCREFPTFTSCRARLR